MQDDIFKSLDPEDPNRPAPVPAPAAPVDDLQGRIERAQRAAALVAEQQRLAAEAEALPMLEAQQAAQREREARKAYLAQVRAEVEAQLVEIRPEVAQLNARYDELVAELEAILAQKDSLQDQIVSAGRTLRAAGGSPQMITAAGFSDPALTLLPSPALTAPRNQVDPFAFGLWRYFFQKHPPFDAAVWHSFI